MDSNRISYRRLASKAGVSFKTLYRVLNNEQHVRPATREKVINALNNNACFDGRVSEQRTVIVAVGDNPYFRLRSVELLQNLSRHPFFPIVCNHEKEQQLFLRKVEDAFSVVIYETVPPELIAKIREANPNATIINISGRSGDISICVDSFEQGRMAGEYLRENGHLHVGIINYGNNSEKNGSAYYRVWGCADVFRYRYPEVKFEIIEGGEASFLPYLKHSRNLPTAFYAPNAYLALRFIREAEKLHLHYPESYSILSTDTPSKRSSQTL